MRFPKSEAKIMALAQKIIAGLRDNDTMTDMKSILHYAEDTVHDDDAKLSELGWGGRAEPHPLQVPGQPRLLEVPEQGAGRLTLDWIFLSEAFGSRGCPDSISLINRFDSPQPKSWQSCLREKRKSPLSPAPK